MDRDPLRVHRKKPWCRPGLHHTRPLTPLSTARLLRRTPSGAELRRLLRLLPEPVLLVSSNRITFSNRPAQLLLGASAGQLTGCAPLSLFHPDSIAKARSRLAARVAEPPSLPLLTERVLRADGSTRTVQTSVTLISARPRRLQLVFLHDVTELQHHRGQLLRAQHELQQLGVVREEVADERRRRLARALHDELQQSLVSIQLELGAMGDAASADDQQVGRTLSRVNEVTTSAMDSAQRIINEIQPLILEELGLAPALESLVRQFGRQTGLETRFTTIRIDEEACTLDLKTVTGLYRVAEGALARITSQARATRVEVVLECGNEGGIHLRVRDDGAAATEQPDPGLSHDPASRLSLLSMRERMRAIGGSLVLQAQPEGGQVLEASLPAAGKPATPANEAGPDESAEAYRLLLSFLYRSPVGMLQATLDGHIELMNPMAVQMLLPMAGVDGLSNLFDLLAEPLPSLQQMVQAQTQRSGAVCEGLPLRSPAGAGQPPRRLSLSLMKQDGVRLTAVVADEMQRSSDDS